MPDNKLPVTLFLCGFMGCGKSAVGRRLAKALGAEFIDMDAYIVKKAGMPIPEIFEKLGEPAFREMETRAIREMGGREPLIVATGGGALLRPENAALANQVGKVLFLDVPFPVCYRRIRGDQNRPLVVQNSRKGLEQIYRTRKPLYQAAATITVRGRPRLPDTVSMILRVLKIEPVGKPDRKKESLSH